MSYEYKALIEQAIIDDDRPLDWEEGQNTVYQATREFYIEVVGNVYENKNFLRSE